MDYQVEGGFNTFKGDIESLVAHGGVFHIYGNVGSMVQHGGVIYDHRQVKADRVQIVTDKMSDQERGRLNDQILRLQDQLNRSNRECEHLRKKLNEGGSDEPRDDVLVQRICSLRNELDKEKEAHKKDVDDLNYRIDTILDELNGYHEYCYDDHRHVQDLAINDEMFDVLFTFINLYPFTSDRDLAFEFGITKAQVKTIANILKMAKSSEARREAADYLQRQHRELIERRGGDQGNYADAKPVDKVGKYGRLIKSYDSMKAAARDNGLCAETVRKHCNRYHKANKLFTKDGYTFRFKKK